MAGRHRAGGGGDGQGREDEKRGERRLLEGHGSVAFCGERRHNGAWRQRRPAGFTAGKPLVDDACRPSRSECSSITAVSTGRTGGRMRSGTPRTSSSGRARRCGGAALERGVPGERHHRERERREGQGREQGSIRPGRDPSARAVAEDETPQRLVPVGERQRHRQLLEPARQEIDGEDHATEQVERHGHALVHADRDARQDQRPAGHEIAEQHGRGQAEYQREQQLGPADRAPLPSQAQHEPARDQHQDHAHGGERELHRRASREIRDHAHR